MPDDLNMMAAAKQWRLRLLRELKRVDELIAELEIDPDHIARRVPRVINPKADVIARHCLQLIEAAGRPLSLRELLDGLAADGLKLLGQEPDKVLITKLWRAKDIIKRVRGVGYMPAQGMSAGTVETQSGSDA